MLAFSGFNFVHLINIFASFLENNKRFLGNNENWKTLLESNKNGKKQLFKIHISGPEEPGCTMEFYVIHVWFCVSETNRRKHSWLFHGEYALFAYYISFATILSAWNFLLLFSDHPNSSPAPDSHSLYVGRSQGFKIFRLKFVNTSTSLTRGFLRETRMTTCTRFPRNFK